MRQKAKSMRQIKQENRRLRAIVLQYNNDAMQIVMALNQLDTITNVEDKDLKAFAENTMTALLKRRQSKGFRAFVDLFGQIHDKDGKI